MILIYGCFQKWRVFPPKSSIKKIGFSIISKPSIFWDTSILGKPQVLSHLLLVFGLTWLVLSFFRRGFASRSLWAMIHFLIEKVLKMEILPSRELTLSHQTGKGNEIFNSKLPAGKGYVIDICGLPVSGSAPLVAKSLSGLRTLTVEGPMAFLVANQPTHTQFSSWLKSGGATKRNLNETWEHFFGRHIFCPFWWSHTRPAL